MSKPRHWSWEGEPEGVTDKAGDSRGREGTWKCYGHQRERAGEEAEKRLVWRKERKSMWGLRLGKKHEGRGG